MTNLTPAQLEQFESTFRYFDRDESNTLNQSEMIAALASLGMVYSVITLPQCFAAAWADFWSRMPTWITFMNSL
jgi:Ca2+-binding EF-hand superfamily protein